ncbi:MAG TPA: MerR family transcriptional regulator [Terriglobales bacterium]|nr:MerR family transcriptional regulator [Terriglobales bacterium]
MRIGELSKRAGLNIQTIRFYERKQVLREPQRTSSGYRCYESADLERLIFIRQSQMLGFTLREIRQMVELHHQIARLPSNGAHSRECRTLATMTQEKLSVIEEKIAALKSMRRELRGMLRQLESQLPRCPGKPANLHRT